MLLLGQLYPPAPNAAHGPQPPSPVCGRYTGAALFRLPRDSGRSDSSRLLWGRPEALLSGRAAAPGAGGSQERSRSGLTPDDYWLRSNPATLCHFSGFWPERSLGSASRRWSDGHRAATCRARQPTTVSGPSTQSPAPSALARTIAHTHYKASAPTLPVTLGHVSVVGAGWGERFGSAVGGSARTYHHWWHGQRWPALRRTGQWSLSAELVSFVRVAGRCDGRTQTPLPFAWHGASLLRCCGVQGRDEGLAAGSLRDPLTDISRADSICQRRFPVLAPAQNRDHQWALAG